VGLELLYALGAAFQALSVTMLVLGFRARIQALHALLVRLLA
jgi:hypothetical protein